MPIYSDSIKNLYNLHENLAAFIQNNASTIVGKAGMVVTYNYRLLHDSLTEFIAERTRIINKYGTADGEGNVTIDRETEEGAQASACRS